MPQRFLTSMHVQFSKIPSLCWEFADFHEHEQGGSYSNFPFNIFSWFIILLNISVLLFITDETTYDESVFVTYAKENTREMKFDSTVPEFLARDVPVVIRSVMVEGDEQNRYLKFQNDLDGMVVELRGLQGLKMKPRQFNLINKTRTNLKYISPMLKKHIDITGLSKSSRRIFTSCLGIQLFYHNGWECYMALTPATECPDHLTKETVRLLTEEFFLRLKRAVRITLQRETRKGVASKHHGKEQCCYIW